MEWKIKPHPDMPEEDQKHWKRTIEQHYLRKKTHRIEEKAKKGILVADKLGQKKIDLDKWLGKREKEGFVIDETPEGITLEKKFDGKRKIFISKHKIFFETKKEKAKTDLQEVL